MVDGFRRRFWQVAGRGEAQGGLRETTSHSKP
jgi:hypothetical protein